jgi:hypothetical protein
MWIDESAFTIESEARVRKHGRPRFYSDAMSQAVLTPEHVYHFHVSSPPTDSWRKKVLTELYRQNGP